MGTRTRGERGALRRREAQEGLHADALQQRTLVLRNERRVAHNTLAR